MEGVERRLAAILALDVVGYSRLMGADETGTLERLKAVRADVIDPLIEEHHGRIVKLMGDGMLVEFISAVHAVDCAVDIQTAMKRRNDAQADGPPMQLRIGINSGDIIIDGDDIYGDGVNIAARLESIADVGGVFVSGFVQDSAKNKVKARFQDQGERSLKNIDHPVRVYRIDLDGAVAVRQGPRRLLPVLAIVAAIVAFVGGLWLWQDSRPTEVALSAVTAVNPTSDGRAGQPVRNGEPVVAVLPLNNFSDDKNQDYFSDGLSEDLITDISKVAGLRVIARNSTFVYKGQSVDIRAVGQALGATHVVEGSVRKAAGTVRITVQLIDARDGSHVWAERYDRELKDIFAIQDEVAAKIVTTLARQLVASSDAPRKDHQTDNVAAYEEFLQGWALFNRRSADNLAEAVDHFERAVQLDPNYARAHAALAAVYWEAWKRFWDRALGLPQNYIAWEMADEHLQHALRSPTPLALRVSSEMLLINRRYTQAMAEAQAAIDLDPNDPLGYVELANAKAFSGHPAEAVALVKKAMALDPHYPPSYLFTYALAEFGLERYGEAAALLSQAIERNAGDPFWFALLVAAYGQSNEPEKAALALARMDALQAEAGMPRFTVGWPVGRWPYKNRADAERLKTGFLAGGMPEG